MALASFEEKILPILQAEVLAALPDGPGGGQEGSRGVVMASSSSSSSSSPSPSSSSASGDCSGSGTGAGFVECSPASRRQLAAALGLKSLLFAIERVYATGSGGGGGGGTKQAEETAASASLDPRLASAAAHFQRPLSGGTQRWTPPPSHQEEGREKKKAPKVSAHVHAPLPGSRAAAGTAASASESPVGLPIPKLEAEAQCAGETLYTSDLPLPAGSLFAAPAAAQQCGKGTKLSGIDASAALASAGAVAFVSAEDVSKIGASNSILGTGYTVFAAKGEEIKFVGQIVGLGEL